jgi:hypothetical protein
MAGNSAMGWDELGRTCREIFFVNCHVMSRYATCSRWGIQIVSIVGLWVETRISALRLYNNTKLTVAVSVKSHSKACSDCTLLLDVNNWQRFLDLRDSSLHSWVVSINPSNPLRLFKANKYNNLHKFNSPCWKDKLVVETPAIHSAIKTATHSEPHA